MIREVFPWANIAINSPEIGPVKLGNLVVQPLCLG
jgi:hypothetical protein